MTSQLDTDPTCQRPLRIPDPQVEPTVSVPRAGALFGLKRDQSYRAAALGKIPTIQLSERRKVVPTLPLLRMLGHEYPSVVTDQPVDSDLVGAS